MRPTRDEWAMAIALTTSKRGTCLRRQVGCVLLDKDGFILSTGYNGRAAGQMHCNEVDEETTSPIIHPWACKGACSPSGTNLDACEAIHAEQNALLRCADVRQIRQCFVTASPCMTCTKLLLNTGCREIIFAEPYAHDEFARELWTRDGRVWKQLHIC